MIGAGEDELICDFAEVYHIYDYKSLPASRAAILAYGLRDDSRIKMKMRGEKLTLTETLAALMIDVFAEYAAVMFGAQEAPISILDELNGVVRTDEDESEAGRIEGFDSPDALKERLRKLRGES